MKELPILFNRPMVRAILDGRKTQTRRVIKPQPRLFVLKDYNILNPQTDDWKVDKYNGGPEWAFWNGNKMSEPRTWKCPYGQPGDRLWVRETWADLAGEIHYRADCFGSPDDQLIGWKPSIHMPRWASRINLEITAVRVERLQDISVEDALSEGIGHGRVSPVLEFMELWDSINAASGYSWDSNPWVWVVVFGRGK